MEEWLMDTNMLKKEIESQVTKVFPGIDLKQINFCEGGDNSPEGTYVFYKNNKYHILFTEKGKIRTHKEYESIDDILWEVLDIVLFNIAMEYAVKNKEKGRDFRRLLFAKEIELYAKFGKDFENRKINEINHLLEENPYIDK